MRIASRLVSFALMGLLLSLPVLGAEDKDKKAGPKKDDAGNKSTVQKPDAKKPPAKKEAPKAKEKPAEKWIKLRAVAGKVVRVDEAKKSLRVQLQLTKKKHVDVEWPSIDDVKVRKPNPPPQFDDKGRIKRRYTRKELRELKGDPKLPGFPAEFSDLKPGQYVQVMLVRKKGRPRRIKGVPADPTGEYSPHMSLILILSDPK